MPVWVDRLAVGLIVGGAGWFVVARAVRRAADIVARHPTHGDADAACGCGGCDAVGGPDNIRTATAPPPRS